MFFRVVIGFILSIGLLSPVRSAVITVSVLTETALDNAIQSANTSDTIHITGFGVITFTDSITIDKPLTITTDGVGAITLNGNDVTKFFHVVTTGNASVYMNKLSFTQGFSIHPGGAINYTATGTGNFLRLNNCVFTENVAQNFGGAVAVQAQGSLIIDSTTFADNTGNNGGGAIAALGDRNIDVAVAYFSGNTALTNGGGAIYVGGSSGLSIEQTTFNNNAAPVTNGGALLVNSSSHSIVNSTFYNNTAGYGGAIYTNDQFGNISMTCCTIYNNTATTDGGGFYMNGGISMTHTVLAGNTTGGTPNDFTRDATNLPNLISNNYNFIGYDPGTEVFGPDPNDQIGTTATIDPMLGLFQDNGGYAFTLMPLAVSPLVDVGDLTAISFVNVDQTGNARAFNGSPDVGAIEYVLACDPLIVNKTEDDGTCGTLRAAIEYANQNPYSTITFEVDDAISLNTSLSPLTGEGTIVEGKSSGVPTIIEGLGVPICFNIQADYISIRGVALEGFTDYGIYDAGYNALEISNIYIGVEPEENTPMTGPNTGIFIQNAYDVFLGQSMDLNIRVSIEVGDNYVTNCSNAGIHLDNVIGEINNFYIGTDLTGMQAYPNATGILIENCTSSLRVIENTVSGNTGAGIQINNSSFVNVINNIVGLDESGINSLENTIGIEIVNSNNLTIGPDNYISGNDDQGIYAEDSRELLIIGNNIGLGINGEQLENDGYSNWPGIELENTPRVTIGGTSTFERNIISNNLTGVQINNGSDSVVVIGNYIGLDPTGTYGRGGSGIGIGVVRSDYISIGDGTAAGENVIAGSIDAISFTRANNFLVDHNKIGLDATGTKKVTNYGGDGIRISNIAGNNTQDTIRNNTIAYRAGTAILIATSIDSVVVTQNVIFQNGNGINLNTNSNAQQGVKPPSVLNYNGTAYTGIAAPGAKVEVFADKVDQGQLFLGSTVADVNGDWTFTYDNANIPLGLNYITAIQDSAGQSSAFSQPYEWQDCSYLTANILTEEFDAYSCVDTIFLEAETPPIGGGFWDCLTAGGTIVDPTSASTVVENLPLGVSEYKWVVTDGTCQVESYIEVNYEGYKRVNAGPDQLITTSNTTLSGTPLTEGETGGQLPIEWILLNGDGEFENPSDPNTAVTGLAPGNNVIMLYAYTEFGFCPGLDTLDIYYNLEYANPDAGQDQLVCLGETTLDANHPGIEDESYGWVFASGPSTPSIEDPQNPKTKVTGLIEGTYRFVWNIDDGDSNESDTVAIVSAIGPAKPTPTSWLVDNTNDAGCGSLRQAVLESVSGDTIIIDAALTGDTIDLTTGEIIVDHLITVLGPASKVKLQNTAGSVFVVDNAEGIELLGLEFINSTDALKILNGQFIRMDSVCFSFNNRAVLDSSTARLYITKSIFEENHLYNDGAGIHKFSGGNIEIDSSKFYNNWSDNYSGAAIYARDIYLIIRYSELVGNVSSVIGGAVYLEGGYLSVYSSSFIDNTAFVAGGAIGINNYGNQEGYASIVNATFSDNFSDGYGGAIASDTSELNISFSTIVRNNTYSGAGGIYSSDQNIFLKSSIVAENTAYGTPFDIACEGCLVRSFGNNLIGDTTGISFQFSGTGDTLGNASTQADPLLEDLVYHENLYQIHIPKVNSPVIDAGGYESSYSVDQIGNQRPFNNETNSADIGAIEYQKATACTDSLYVTLTDNSGCGSLRAAIIYANNNPGNDTVTFDSALQGETIELLSDIAIYESITILGLPHTINTPPVVVTGISSRVFEVLSEDDDFTVTIHDLSFQNSILENLGEDGGAIKMDYKGDLYLKRCEFINNSATGNGGGLYFDGNNFQADSCVFRENTTDDNTEGGGVFISVINGNAYFNNCIIENNQAGKDVQEYSAGGGVKASVSYGEIVFDKCLFDGNSAGEGGALHTYGDAVDSVVVYNSTFTENQGWGGGGAIYAGNSGEVFLYNSTLVNNMAIGYANTLMEGGAVYASATLYMVNSVFANNQGDPANIRAYAYEVESWGHNFIDDTSNTQGYDAFYSLLDIKGYNGNVLDPGLDALAENGGYTPTMMPLQGSPLIDAGNNAFVTTIDQNFNPRVIGESIDIGAVEVQDVFCEPPIADAGQDVEVCGDNISMMASEPLNGETGQWIFYVGTGVFDDEAIYNTEVFDLEHGENILIWSITNSCGVAYDTVMVYADTGFVANNDTINIPENAIDFNIPFALNDSSLTSIMGVGLTNDITGAPRFGSTNVDETLNFLEILYTPAPEYYGNDTIDYSVVDNCERQKNARIFIYVVPYFPEFENISQQVIKGDSSIFTFTVPSNITTFGISDSLNYGKGDVALDLTTLSLKVNYKLTPDFVGEDSMQFYLCKGSVCDSTYLKLFVGEFEEEKVIPLNVYNGVSPNGDEKNDYLKIDKDPSHGKISLIITNRWGDIIFRTDDYDSDYASKRWDGTKNGETIPDGTYYYVLETSGENKERKEGFILLKK